MVENPPCWLLKVLLDGLRIPQSILTSVYFCTLSGFGERPSNNQPPAMTGSMGEAINFNMYFPIDWFWVSSFFHSIAGMIYSILIHIYITYIYIYRLFWGWSQSATRLSMIWWLGHHPNFQARTFASWYSQVHAAYPNRSAWSLAWHWKMGGQGWDPCSGKSISDLFWILNNCGKRCMWEIRYELKMPHIWPFSRRKQPIY